MASLETPPGIRIIRRDAEGSGRPAIILQPGDALLMATAMGRAAIEFEMTLEAPFGDQDQMEAVLKNEARTIRFLLGDSRLVISLDAAGDCDKLYAALTRTVETKGL